MFDQVLLTIVDLLADYGDQLITETARIVDGDSGRQVETDGTEFPFLIVPKNAADDEKTINREG
jgi:hypothetical protein